VNEEALAHWGEGGVLKNASYKRATSSVVWQLITKCNTVLSENKGTVSFPHSGILYTEQFHSLSTVKAGIFTVSDGSN